MRPGKGKYQRTDNTKLEIKRETFTEKRRDLRMKDTNKRALET
jgi:hypothetical protein